MARFVYQKIFQRRKQVRAKSSFFLAHAVQIFAFQDQSEKALCKILRLLWPGTLSPHEAINGSPIGAAKSFKRLLCRWRFTLRLQHQAPVRRGKRRRAVKSISANRGQWSDSLIHPHSVRILTTTLKQ